MAGPFLSIFRVAAFFVAVWLAGRAARQLKVSTILPEILTGIVLGPHGFMKSALGWGLVPEAYTTCVAKATHTCDDNHFLTHHYGDEEGCQKKKDKYVA